MRSTRRTESWAGVVTFALLGVIAALVALFMPPLPDRPVYEGAGATTPQRGGTFVFFHTSDVHTLDPHVAYDELSLMALKLLEEGLVEHEADLTIVPRLARSLPEVSEDGRLYTFTLREGLRFSNGRAITAEDVRWSFEHMLHPDTNSPGVPFFSLIEGVDEYREGRAPHVRGIAVRDERTVEFRLSAPDQTFLHAMGMSFAFVVAREAYEPGRDADREPIGAGAFVLEAWEPGVRITFARNPHFFIEGQPYVDRMVYELNLSPGTAFMRFSSGQVDHIHRFPNTDYLRFRQLSAWEPYRVSHPHPDISGVQMNCELPPFDDRHVRRAVAFAMNRERWERMRQGRVQPMGQPVPSSLAGYDPYLPELQRYDLAAARREMALAGHPVHCEEQSDGTERCVAEGLDAPIDLWLGESGAAQQYGAVVMQDLAAIGLNIRLRPVSFPVYLAETGRPRTVPMMIGAWSIDFPDPASVLEPLFHSRFATESNASNRTFYRNPELDALLDRARVERDPEARARMYREASSIVAADAPWAFTSSSVAMQAWQPYVRGYVPHPFWNQMYRDVWLDLPRRSFGGERGDRLSNVLEVGAFR